MRLLLAGALAAVAISGSVAAEPVSVDVVIGAERAFAARHQSATMKEAFLEFVGPEGISLTPQGTKKAKDYIATWPDRPGGFIKWWPTLAGVAQSGDLGFTTGPASYAGGKFYGDYFSIWKKQPDGSWKWIMDQGAGEAGRSAAQPTDNVLKVPVSDVAPMDPAMAKASLLAADVALGKGKLAEPASVKKLYAPEVRLLGYGADPIDGLDRATAALSKGRTDLALTQEGGDVSQAGDLGYTYGYATWTEDGKPVRAPYLRAWQRRASGWVVLVENINPFRTGA